MRKRKWKRGELEGATSYIAFLQNLHHILMRHQQTQRIRYRSGCNELRARSKDQLGPLRVSTFSQFQQSILEDKDWHLEWTFSHWKYLLVLIKKTHCTWHVLGFFQNNKSWIIADHLLVFHIFLPVFLDYLSLILK